jgi:hypothetical protein
MAASAGKDRAMSLQDQTHHLRIHIDHKPYHSPDPTTGRALYALAGIGEHAELFREVEGNQEDLLIDRHAPQVRIREDDHFYSQRAFTIIVNTEAKEVVKRRLTYEDVVKLAYERPPHGPNIVITIDFANGPPSNPSGVLRKGHSIRIKNGMEFDVSATDRS